MPSILLRSLVWLRLVVAVRVMMMFIRERTCFVSSLLDGEKLVSMASTVSMVLFLLVGWFGLAHFMRLAHRVRYISVVLNGLISAGSSRSVFDPRPQPSVCTFHMSFLCVIQ